MKKIDAHFHVNFQGFDADQIISYLDKNGIEKCWLLTWEENRPPISSIYEHLSYNDLLNAYSKYPDRFVPFYAPDPESESLRDIFNNMAQKGIKGCGELKVTYKWEDKIMENYLNVLSEFNIPLLFHMELPRPHFVPVKINIFENLLEKLMNGALNGIARYYILNIIKYSSILSKKIEENLKFFPGYLYDFINLENRIKQFPNQTFIGHGPHFWNNISDNISMKYIHQRGKYKTFGIIDSLLEKYENFYCDISGTSGYNALTRDLKKSKYFLEKHSKKVLFGTDNTKYDFINLLNSLKLSKEKLDQIYYTNAQLIIKS